MTEAANAEPVQPKHEPTLERDGFEVRGVGRNNRPDLPPGLKQISMGRRINTGDLEVVYEYLVFDPNRADAFGVTATNGADREALVGVLRDEAGFKQFTPDFDIHVVVARTKPQ